MMFTAHHHKSHTSVRLPFLILLVLTVAVFSVYWPVRDFDFVALDDNLYVTENPYVIKGLTAEGLRWAFDFKDLTFYSYWQPLTWLSHMLDVQIYRLNPGQHHLTNLIWHLLNSLLLFLLLYRATGAIWQSTFVAAVFALHPINVESVAWVASRKNLLSTFFWIVTLMAYHSYAAHPSARRYVLLLLVFMLGLMSKPMLVTIPFVFLLMDFWPLDRWRLPASAGPPVSTSGNIKAFSGGQKVAASRLVLEKIPFFVLSAASVTFSTAMARSYQTDVSFDLIPLTLRLTNAVVSGAKYISKMFWPHDLALLYPFPDRIATLQLWLAGLVLAGITGVVLSQIRTRSYLAFGWFWYLGTLVPVIGLVQVGIWPEMADRWAYVPLIGLYIMIAWGGADLFRNRRLQRAALAAIAIAAIVSLALLTRLQVGYWQDSTTLFSHTLAVTRNNVAIHNNLGVVLQKRGDIDGAIEHYRAALSINPGAADAMLHWGNALLARGKYADAAEKYQQALRISPNFAKAHYNLGAVLQYQGRFDQALEQYREAIRIRPQYAEAHNNLGSVLVLQGRFGEAARYFERALQIKPDYPDARFNLDRIRQKRARSHE